MSGKKRGYHIHILDEEKLGEFDDKYLIRYDSGYIMISMKGRNYTRVKKDDGSNFRLYLTKSNKIMTNITINKIAVEYGKKHPDVSLVRIQNAVNKLTIGKKTIDDEAIKENL